MMSVAIRGVKVLVDDDDRFASRGDVTFLLRRWSHLFTNSIRIATMAIFCIVCEM